MWDRRSQRWAEKNPDIARDDVAWQVLRASRRDLAWIDELPDYHEFTGGARLEGYALSILARIEAKEVAGDLTDSEVASAISGLVVRVPRTPVIRELEKISLRLKTGAQRSRADVVAEYPARQAFIRALRDIEDKQTRAAQARAERERRNKAERLERRQARDATRVEQLSAQIAAMSADAERRTRQRQEKMLARHVPPPPAQPFGVSDEGAEALVCAWVRHLGARDAEVTRFSGDGGIDVESAFYVIQVKNYSGSVPIESIRALHGVATVEKKRALFFTSGTVSREGVSFADRARIGLVHYDAVNATLRGLNTIGEAAVDEGLKHP